MPVVPEQLPPRVVQIVRALYERHLDLARGDDEQRRQLAEKIQQQTCYELGPLWGSKRADPGRPKTKDAIAYSDPPKLYAWDLFSGETREPHPNPDRINITGQVFVPVEPKDHLGVSSPPISAPPVWPPEDVLVVAEDDIDHIAERVATKLEARLALIEQALQALLNKPPLPAPPITFPSYRSSGWITVRLHPVLPSDPE